LSSPAGDLQKLADVCDVAFLERNCTGLSLPAPTAGAWCCHAALACYLGAGSNDLNNDHPFCTFLASRLPAATQTQDVNDRLLNQVTPAANCNG